MSHSCYTRAIRAISITEMAFCSLVLLLVLLQHFLILLTAIILLSLSQLLNKHSPLKSKIIRTKSLNLWFSQALKNLNLLNVILSASGLVLIALKILKTFPLPQIMLP